jgi:hypothetical protein
VPRAHVSGPEEERAEPESSVPASGPEPLRLDPRGVLRLQRAIGNAAVARLVLSRSPGGTDDLLLAPNPYDDPEYLREWEERMERLRGPLLAALRRPDSVSFLNRLDALAEVDRRSLLADETFMAEVRRRLGPMGFWIVQLRLKWGGRMPQEVRELHMAVHAKDPVDVINALRAHRVLVDGSTPGVRDVLRAVFAGKPELAQMEGVLAAGTSIWSTVEQSYREVHYEETSGGFLGLFPSYGLKRFGGTGKYELHRVSGELRVVVKIKLIEDDTSGPDERVTTAIVNRWRDGIQRKWNRGFRAVNGRETMRVIFVPLFRFHGDDHHHVVHVQRKSRRENQSHWALDTEASTAAHEFGHMLGLSDEYRLPATIREAMAAGLSEADARRSSVEGITGERRTPKEGGYSLPGIMSQNDVVLARHVLPIVVALNQKLRQPGEPLFRLEGP